jgi:hypothetical protein
MLTVCFDASGKTPSSITKRKSRNSRIQADSDVVAVAGFASQAGMWAEFDEKWKEVLQTYGVVYFHAGDLASCKGPFATGWRNEEQKKQDLQGELMGVIEDCGLRKFGSVLWTSDQQKAKEMLGLSSDPTATPYVLCARSAVEDFNSHAIGEGQRDSLEYVFEKGDEEHKLRRHFEKHSFHEPTFRWSKPVEKKGITRPPFIGLQAAGWIVWEYYMDFSRWFDKKHIHKVSPPDRWAFNVFDNHRRIPGEVKVLYKSSPFMHWLQNRDSSMPEMQKLLGESTARLEAAKQEGLRLRDNEKS